MDFEGCPDNNLNCPNKKLFPISKSIKFQYMAQLRYFNKLDFAGYPNNNLKYPNRKKNVFRFQNQLNSNI